MKIDRPFFCAISNVETGNIVFLGFIFNPLDYRFVRKKVLKFR